MSLIQFMDVQTAMHVTMILKQTMMMVHVNILKKIMIVMAIV